LVINDVFLHILKLHTLLSTFLRGTGTKTRLYDILKSSQSS